MALAKNKILVGVLLLVLVLFVGLIFHARQGIRQIGEQLEQVNEQLGKVHARLERPISVRLANRSLEIEAASPFPKVFAQHQAPSARGTLPFLVVCREPVSKAAREQAAACGARVVGVIPDKTLLVEADEASLTKIATNGTFAGACELMPPDKVSAELASADSQVDVTLVPLAAADVSAVSNAVVALGGQVLATPAGRVRARVPAARLSALAARGDVRWIERYTPAKLLNDVAVNPGLLNVRKAWAAPHGLTGAGQIITVADTGLDTSNTNTVMADFRGRVNLIYKVDKSYLLGDTHGHGTHVAGSIAGDGSLSDGVIRGVAYGATLNVWQIRGRGGSLQMPDSLDVQFRPDHEHYPSYIFSFSVGYDPGGEYSDICSQYDKWIWNNPDTLVVSAAGNDGPQKVCPPGSAKNTLCVGASQSEREGVYYWPSGNPAKVADRSSRGPTQDGRVKPDICAPGSGILSTRTTLVDSTDWGYGAYSANTNYIYMSGTSMATPLVAGCAALVRQWLVERRGFSGVPPTAALMKAVLTGGAHDMSADAGADCGGAAPNGTQGWGRVDLGEALYPSNRSVRLVDRIPFATGSERIWRVETTRAAPLDVQLVWMDYPATPQGGGGLINDLDLVVSNRTTGAVCWGNGVAGGDRTNNVEGVRIASAPAGTYEVRVRGVTVSYDSTEGGAAALYMRGAFRWGMSVVLR